MKTLTYSVEYTSCVNDVRSIIARAKNEAQALFNAHYICHTGRDFRNAKQVDNSLYTKPRKQGYAGNN